jgi:hypothetical protein
MPVPLLLTCEPFRFNPAFLILEGLHVYWKCRCGRILDPEGATFENGFSVASILKHKLTYIGLIRPIVDHHII